MLILFSSVRALHQRLVEQLLWVVWVFMERPSVQRVFNKIPESGDFLFLFFCNCFLNIPFVKPNQFALFPVSRSSVIVVFPDLLKANDLPSGN